MIGSTNNSARWHAPLRFIKGNSDQLYGPVNTTGYFNGLDYMLLHNLYYLRTTNLENVPYYYSLIEGSVDVNLVSNTLRRSQDFIALRPIRLLGLLPTLI